MGTVTERVTEPPIKTGAGPALEPPPYRAAALAGAAVFVLYVVTLAPTTAFWDASEYITTAHILGIPHPPGNPLFVALARVWSLLLAPLGLSVAVRINLFAAANSAAAAALLGATAFTVWNQSTVNEKVYTLSVLIGAIVSWLALRWYDRRDHPGSDRYVLLALYLMVLGSTNHLMSLLPAPAFAVFTLAVGPAFLLRSTFWIRAIPLVLLGLSFNVFLPIRAAQDPVINEGEPTCEAVGGTLVAVFTNGRTGCPALAANLRRDQYGKPPLTQRQAPFGAQFANWFQYFDWQWSRGLDPSPVPSRGRLPFTLLFLALGLVGLYATLRADARWLAYLGTLALGSRSGSSST